MRLKLIIIFAFICSALTISAQTINSQIDQYLAVRSEMGNFSGAVLVAKEGKVIFTLGENSKSTKVNLRYRGEDHFAERVK